jgi:hypothetical protein
MIRDEEQRARELEQEIELMQSEGHHDLQHGPPLQQRARIPQRGPFIPHAAAFHDINYLDERSPPGSAAPSITMAHQLQGRGIPQVQRQHRPSTIHHELPSHRASSGGDDATMAKSFIIALEGPALTW